MSLVDPPRWTTEEFDEQREKARQVFRDQRLSESQSAYGDAFLECLGHINELFGKTADLTRLETETAASPTDPALLGALTDPDLLEALRYVVGPSRLCW